MRRRYVSSMLNLNMDEKAIMTKSRQRKRNHQRRTRMNTHFYDGKLKEAREQLAPYLDDAAKVDMSTKLASFATFASLLMTRPTTTPQAQHNLQTIIVDYQKHQGREDIHSPNYDPSNNLVVDDLLYFLINLIVRIPEEQQDNFIDLANQQFTEMSSGMCPQGRAYRILQIIWPTLDYIPQ